MREYPTKWGLSLVLSGYVHNARYTVCIFVQYILHIPLAILVFQS